MSHTYSIDQVGSAITTAISVPTLDKTKLGLQRTVPSNNGVGQISTYVVEAGSGEYEATVSVLNYKDKNGARHVTLRLTTYARDTDENGVDVKVMPIEAVIGVTIPPMVIESYDLLDLLGNVYSLAFNTATAGVPDSVNATAMLFGRSSFLE